MDAVLPSIGRLGNSLIIEGGGNNCPKIVRKYADALGISDEEIRATLSWFMRLSDGLSGNEIFPIARSHGLSERRATAIKFLYRCRASEVFLEKFEAFLSGPDATPPLHTRLPQKLALSF